MQLYLYIARHAHALDEAPSDAERPLSPKGFQQARRLGHALAVAERFHARCIWHSELLRAEQTASAFAEALGLAQPLRRRPGLAPYDDPAPVAKELQEISESSCIVGHEPQLSALAAHLLPGSPPGGCIAFAKASMLCLSRLKAGHQATPWQIEWHISHHFFK